MRITQDANVNIDLCFGPGLQISVIYMSGDTSRVILQMPSRFRWSMDHAMLSLDSDQLLSRVRLFVTPAHQTSLSIINSQSLLKR